jgi:hypothetical protein
MICLVNVTILENFELLLGTNYDPFRVPDVVIENAVDQLKARTNVGQHHIENFGFENQPLGSGEHDRAV